MLKANPWTHKSKDLNGEILVKSFYEKELLLHKSKMSFYPEPDSYIKDKVRLDL